jgi:putative membrane protein
LGRYEYSSVLQPQALRVPLALICAWVVMTAYAWQAVSRRFASAAMRAAVGGAWMMALDLLIDPVATNAMSYWRWLDPGPYYGVPLSNFAGWFLAGALLLSLAAASEVYGARRRTC